MSLSAESDSEMIAKLRDAHQKLKSEIGKVIVGQEETIDQLLITFLAGRRMQQ